MRSPVDPTETADQFAPKCNFPIGYLPFLATGRTKLLAPDRRVIFGGVRLELLPTWFGLSVHPPPDASLFVEASEEAFCIRRLIERRATPAQKSS